MPRCQIPHLFFGGLLYTQENGTYVSKDWGVFEAAKSTVVLISIPVCILMQHGPFGKGLSSLWFYVRTE